MISYILKYRSLSNVELGVLSSFAITSLSKGGLVAYFNCFAVTWHFVSLPRDVMGYSRGL